MFIRSYMYGQKVLALRLELASKDVVINLAQKALDEMKSDRDKWRAEAERLVSSPQFKVATEAAFKRGEAHALQKVKHFLAGNFMTHIQGIQLGTYDHTMAKSMRMINEDGDK